MGTVHAGITGQLRSFIEAQHMFFVATAPSQGGHLNLSPKGLDTLRITGERMAIFLDYVGSGAETIAHLRDNGRIIIMLCAFEGSPKIVRLHGRGEVLEPQHPEYASLRALFAPEIQARSVIRIHVERVSDSCGYGVPLYSFTGHRSQLRAWSERKGADGLIEYQIKNNRESIDGLPALEGPNSRR